MSVLTYVHWMNLQMADLKSWLAIQSIFCGLLLLIIPLNWCHSNYFWFSKHNRTIWFYVLKKQQDFSYLFLVPSLCGKNNSLGIKSLLFGKVLLFPDWIQQAREVLWVFLYYWEPVHATLKSNWSNFKLPLKNIFNFILLPLTPHHNS